MSIKYNHYLKSAYTLENILKNTVFQYLDCSFHLYNLIWCYIAGPCHIQRVCSEEHRESGVEP